MRIRKLRGSWAKSLGAPREVGVALWPQFPQLKNKQDALWLPSSTHHSALYTVTLI